MKHKLLLIWVWMVPIFCFSNGIQLSNLTTTYNATTQVATVNFDLIWKNSWRSTLTNNWDAAWVFFKYNNGGSWMHLSPTGNDVTIPSGFTYSIPSDKTGIMIYRDAAGTGDVTLTGCKVGVPSQWGNFDIKAFALEMVYIPQDSFYVGDGNSTTHAYRNGNSLWPPLKITADTITMGTSANQLNDVGGNGTLATGFPTGFKAFYLMKYELSWGGFRDFLNCLTFSEQINHTVAPNSAAGTRWVFNTPTRVGLLKIVTPGIVNGAGAVFGCDADNDNIYNEGNDGENIAVDSVHWMTSAAYLDWSGLRPFTELEYEKACRGPEPVIQREFAWGSAGFQANVYTIIYANTDSEAVSNTVYGGMFNNSSSNFSTNLRPGAVLGTLRCGIFGKANSNRWQSGASYYGAMDLTGNAYEFCVNTSSVAGRSFTGVHGDGILYQGRANQDYWPGVNGNTNLASANGTGGTSSVTQQAGIMVRGGSYMTTQSNSHVSERVNINYTGTLNRVAGFSIRGARNF